jgi:23S rRNA (adenine2503-C2)-methyltransferase
MDRALLQQRLSAHGEAAYRAGQVWEWAARGAVGYHEMTNLPRSLRAQLEQEVPFSTLELVQEAKASDGTVKALFRTGEGHPVEAVLMRYRDGRRSVCLSSQSGCPLTCAFCATGQMRFGRNLTASEILDQALHFRRIEPVDHAVFMGMGEPMLNLDSVLEAARALPDVGITWRRTTISTVGWLPGLRRDTRPRTVAGDGQAHAWARHPSRVRTARRNSGLPVVASVCGRQKVARRAALLATDPGLGRRSGSGLSCDHGEP